jgi:hypothetical protein
VQIAEVTILATHQASPFLIARPRVHSFDRLKR